MGFVDEIKAKAAAAINQPGADWFTIAKGAYQLLETQGGISKIAETFQQKGLGDIVQSWISTGKNLPISVEQIKSVLGADRLAELSQKTNLPLEQIAGKLTEVLPKLVDGLTPNGTVPAELPGADALSKLLGNKLN